MWKWCILVVAVSIAYTVIYLWANQRESIVIGMEIGNSYSRVGMIRNGEAWYSEKIPSCVSFDKHGDIYVGTTVNPPGVSFYGFRKFVGYSHRRIKERFTSLPYKVFSHGPNKDLHVEIPLDVEDASHKEIPIELLLTALMAELKRVAEENLHAQVSSAVLVVPFNVSQRQMRYTRRAAKIINLNIIRFIPEPIATALSHEYNKRKSDDDARELINYDAVVIVGGSHVDVAVVIAEDLVSVGAISMETISYGAEGITVNIAKKITEDLVSSNKLSNVQGHIDLKQRIYREAERIKWALSIHPTADYVIEAWDPESGRLKIINGTMTLNNLEQICPPLLKEIMSHLEQVLDQGDFTHADIENVFLTMSKSESIPGLRESITKFFPDNQIIECTSCSLHGAMLSAAQEMNSLPEELKINRYLPESLGIRLSNGKMKVLVKKGVYLPYHDKIELEAYNFPGFPFLTIKSYYGSNVIASQNTLLSKFELSGVASGYDDIEFDLKVDENICIELKATNLRLGASEFTSPCEVRSTNEGTDLYAESQMTWLLSELEKNFEKQVLKKECEMPLRSAYLLKQSIRKGDFEKVSRDQVKQLKMLADEIIHTVENEHPSSWLECHNLQVNFDKRQSEILDAV